MSIGTRFGASIAASVTVERDATARRMKAAGAGVIINMGSTNAIVGHPFYADYNASKAGVLGRLAARALGVPCVHTFHGHVLDGYFARPVAGVIARAERGLARWAQDLEREGASALVLAVHEHETETPWS